MRVATSDIKASSDGFAAIRNATLIAGPTASGKSRLALELARKRGGVVVNADSMQVYRELRVLTARPSEEDEALALHALYGHRTAARAYSTGAWLNDVAELARGQAFGRRPIIFVGGTGLYLKALLGGLSDIPDIPPDIRTRWRERLRNEGPRALHEELGRIDAAAAASLRPSDGQRIARALEVREATGLSIRAWQAGRGAALVDPATAELIVLEPDRKTLVGRIDSRFDRMMNEGAVEEVGRLLALHLDPALPAMKAIGVPEIAAALSGEMRFSEAARLAKIASRQYAKRQATWFRNQLGSEWRRIKGDII